MLLVHTKLLLKRGVSCLAQKDMQDFDKIIVLDYGSQYNQLITRRIREFGIFWIVA